MTQNRKLVVLSSVPPPLQVTTGTEAADIATTTTGTTTTTTTYDLDQLDDFNHPRQRRDIILQALQQEQIKLTKLKKENDDNNNKNNHNIEIIFDIQPCDHRNNQFLSKVLSKLFHTIYSSVHSTLLLTFLESSWSQWRDLGIDGRDPIGFGSTSTTGTTGTTTTTTSGSSRGCSDSSIPPLIPACTPLFIRGGPLNHSHPTAPTQQRPSKHVIGQMSYYCTDTCTPIFHNLITELYSDTILLQTCLNHIRTTESSVSSSSSSSSSEKVDENNNNNNNNNKHLSKKKNHSVYYILPHHPGHHAAYDCFGGYCYVNHIAALAQNILHIHDDDNNNNTNENEERVVILDVDYHCGNGTASIAHHINNNENNDDINNVMVISIHCDPDYDYPFHMGFADDSTTHVIHIPLPPGTGWDTGYRTALLQAMTHIQSFAPTTLLVSLGLDTYHQDPCTIRRAGFTLQSNDYIEMGTVLATEMSFNNNNTSSLRRTIFVQEGGYRMDTIGEAAKNVVVSYTQHI